MTETPWWRSYREPAWRVVGVGVAVQLLHFGLFQQAYSVYVPVLVDTMGWSAASLGLVFALHQAVAGAIGPVQGRALSRWGAARLATIGTVILAAAMIGLSLATDVLVFGAWFVLGALGQYLAGFLTLTTCVVTWFGRASAWPLSLMQTGLSFAGLVVPIVALAISSFGWRSVLLVSALVIAATGIPLARHLTTGPNRPSAAVASSGGVERAYREAVTSTAFWAIASGHALALAVVHGVNVYFVLYVTARGVPLPVAASMVALSTLAMLAGQLSGGVLGVRYTSRWLAAGCMALHAIALMFLVSLPSAAVIAPFAVLHGFAWGVRGPIMQAMRVEYFGTDAFPRVMGTSLMIATVGAVIGPYAVGVAADLGLGFDGAFTALGAVAVLGAVAFAIARRPVG